MPFTISHVAAVLPFGKRTPLPFSFTALIIGSVVPDFEYFVRMTLYGHYGHTLPGIFTFDIPLGLCLYIVYHGVVHMKLIPHLPPFLYRRFNHTLNFRWRPYLRKNFLNILLSLFVGILTHFIWDGFTHDEEYRLARYIPFLLHVVHIGGYAVPLHFILQFLSSIAGMVILAVYIYRMPQDRTAIVPLPAAVNRYWTVVCITGILIGTVRWWIGVPDEKLFGQFVVVSMSAFMLSLIIVSCAYRNIIPAE